MNLNQVTVPSLDLERSIVFYQKLGLELIVHAPPRYARFLCREGGATFSIHLTTEISQGEKPVLYFECENMDQKVQELIDEGIGFDELPNDKKWLWREARLKDPFDNPLVIYLAGENRINPPWKIRK